MLRDYAAHYGEKIFAGFGEHERIPFFRPYEFKTGGKSGDPDFADGRVWRNDKASVIRFFENNFQFAAFPSLLSNE
jgi:hypothetical protein